MDLGTSTSSVERAGSDWEGLIGQEYVEKLTESNYRAFLKNQGKKSVLILFYAPWCGHCIKLKPEYANAAFTLSRFYQSTNAVLACIDCVANPKMVGRFNIKGYPTMIFYKAGKPMGEFRQGRASTNIVEFMRKPVISNLVSEKEKEELVVKPKSSTN